MASPPASKTWSPPIWAEGLDFDPAKVPAIVDRLLEAARANRVSDLHLTPEPDGLRVQWRPVAVHR
jgi:type II secretory ATPase GspE/PulE/Tfp pilus assembly ATPase PilB-like protein